MIQRRIFSLVFIVFAFFKVQFSFAQNIDETDTRSLIQANFLYQFASNNNWPAEAKKGKFVIAVLGNSSVYELMAERYGTKPVGKQTIEVVRLNEYPTGQSYHILFIDKSKKGELPKVVKDCKGKSTLIVTNWDGALGGGSHINFKNADGSVRYELNQTAMEDRKIIPGVKILQWKVD